MQQAASSGVVGNRWAAESQGLPKVQTHPLHSSRTADRLNKHAAEHAPPDAAGIKAYTRPRMGALVKVPIEKSWTC